MRVSRAGICPQTEFSPQKPTWCWRPHCGCFHAGRVNSTAGVLGVVDDPGLRGDLERVGAAVGVRVVYHAGLPSRREWTAASAIALDEAAALRCAHGALPRRPGVVLLVADEPGNATWEAAISLGAQHVLRLPQREGDLVKLLSDVGDSGAGAAGGGCVVAVVGGRGGAGASIFSAALAMSASDPLLVDVDPWGGGIDLLLGIELQPGLRWPDIAVESGRLTPAAVRDALPRHRHIGVLSGTRRAADIGTGALLAIVDAGRRGGATVVCDLPRRLTDAAEIALDTADLVVTVGVCDVRSCASLAAMTPTLRAANPNVGLVVRGPSPGGLRAGDVSRAAGLPLLATMRAEPHLAQRLERGGLVLGRHTALAGAARRVLAVLEDHPAAVAA
jgi:secretion/DNA translocation related CpaE-like protein